MDLPSVLGGLAQGFKDFGTSVVDLFGTGGANVADIIESIRTGKATTRNQDDFRKWLYNTDSVKDAAAKGLGTALNGVQTVSDYLPGISALTRNPLGNAAQGALGGLADEFKTYGEDYDLGRAGQRAAVSAAGAAASGSLADALKGSSNALLSSNTLQGLARGATGGAITGGGYAAIDGGDVLEAAKQGAGMGALIGGATGAFQDFRPAKTYDVALTDDERAARIANAQKQIDDIGPVRLFTDDPNELAKRARVNELQDAIKAYQSGYDTVQDYNDALAARRANRQPSLTREEYEAKMQQRIRDLGGNYEVTPEKQAQFDRLQKVNPMRDDYHTGIRAPQDIATLQEAINNAKDIDPAYKAMLQKALADDSVTVYSSYPIEEGVFTTPIKQMAQDYAGPGNQVYSKTISPNDIAWIDDQEGNYLPRPQQLEATLADADMAVNNPDIMMSKLAPEEAQGATPQYKRIYHGTNATFTDFDEKLPSVWFTDNADDIANTGLSNRGGKLNIMERDLPSDLKLADWDLADKYTKQQLIDRGYDGIAYDGSGTSGNDTYYEIFNPNKTLKKVDKDAHYSKATPSQSLEKTLANDDMAVNSPKLTPEQEAYFKDSVIRDENGNLKPMYHGSPDGTFTVFKDGSFFTDDKDYADVYQDNSAGMATGKKTINPKTYEVYLNVKKPFTMADPEARRIIKDEYIGRDKNYWVGPTDETEVDFTEADNLRNWLKKNHPEYDGLYVNEGGGDDPFAEDGWEEWRGNSVVPFSPNQIKDINNLKPTSDVDIMASRMTPDEMDLARALARQDMAVNSAKVAPGQLGLFDDLPTQMPKTTGRQVSIFDQPQEGLDYYGGDVETPVIEPINPYAPVDGQLTQTMRDRAADVLKNWKKNGVPENELYNAINPDTLPAVIKGAKKLDMDGLKSITKDIFGVDDIKKADIGKVVQYAFSDEPNLARYYMGYIQNESPKSSLYKRVQKSAIEAANKKMTGDLVQRLLDSDTIGSDNLLEIKRYTPSDHAIRSGYTAAADEVLSERLGIAPGNTPKYNGPMDTRRSYGRYSHPVYGSGGDLAIFERKMDNPEDAVSTIAHERLHSFQGEAGSRSRGRYSQEVVDAYKELQNDLKDHYKTWEETAERYGRGDTGYWQRTDEQEARMLQNYLENKGYANAPQMAKSYRAGEWGSEINPAFDKFFDKLRELSKRGVALPALAGLLGGGVVLDQVLNSKDSDKDKKKTKRSA